MVIHRPVITSNLIRGAVADSEAQQVRRKTSYSELSDPIVFHELRTFAACKSLLS